MQYRGNEHRANAVKKNMRIDSCGNEIESYRRAGYVEIKMSGEISIRFNIKDETEINYGMVLLYRTGVGSSREIGKIFGRSGVDVTRKVKRAETGIGNLVDGRKSNGREIKLTKEIKAGIWSNVNKEPFLTDEKLTERINREIPAGQELSVKTIKRFLSDSGIGKWRRDMRRESVSAAGNDKRTGTQIMLSGNAGVFIGMSYLEKAGFYDAVGVLKSGDRDKYTTNEVSLTIYFLYLIGRKRIYELDSIPHDGFAALAGRENRHLLSSGAQKRLKEISEESDIEKYEQEYTVRAVKLESDTSTSDRINSIYGDTEVVYADTHVSEIWRKENIGMALHGIKRRKVKAINKHYLVDKTGKVPLVRGLTAGNKRLSQVLPELVKKLKKGLPKFIISFDKGGVSKKVFETCIGEGIGFVAWGPKWVDIRKKIEKIPLRKFCWKRGEEVINKRGKKVNRVVEKICETRINYTGIGKLRTVVIYFMNTGERAWAYTNLAYKEYPSLEIREIIRYKQRVENYFRDRKCFGAIDCFSGGKALRRKVSKPTIKEIIRQQRRIEQQIVQTEEALRQVNSSYSSHLLPEYPYKKAKSMFEERLNNLHERLTKAGSLRRWIEGGKKPEWVLTPYELDLRKERLLTQLQDYAYIVKWQIIKEFRNCYRKVLRQEGIAGKDLETKLGSLDTTNLWRELIGLEGQLVWDHKNKLLDVKLAELRKPLLQKTLQKLCYKLNQNNSVLNLGKGREYKVLLSCG